jgi:hypothetical protein
VWGLAPARLPQPLRRNKFTHPTLAALSEAFPDVVTTADFQDYSRLPRHNILAATETNHSTNHLFRVISSFDYVPINSGKSILAPNSSKVTPLNSNPGSNRQRNTDASPQAATSGLNSPSLSTQRNPLSQLPAHWARVAQQPTPRSPDVPDDLPPTTMISPALRCRASAPPSISATDAATVMRTVTLNVLTPAQLCDERG